MKTVVDYELGTKAAKLYYVLFVHVPEQNEWDCVDSSYDLKDIKAELENQVSEKELSYRQVKIMVVDETESQEGWNFEEYAKKKCIELTEDLPYVYADAHKDLFQYMLLRGYEVKIEYKEGFDEWEVEAEAKLENHFLIEGTLKNIPKVQLLRLNQAIENLAEAVDQVEGCVIHIYDDNGKVVGWAQPEPSLLYNEVIANYGVNELLEGWNKQYNHHY